MSWLNRLNPSVKGAEIKHFQWKRPGGSSEITEDLFVNPDASSPVAAVMTVRAKYSEGSNIGIELVARKGQGKNLNRTINEVGLSFGGVSAGFPDQGQEILRGLGIDPPAMCHVLLMHSGPLSEKREQVVERVEKIIAGFLDSDLISREPAIRSAMVDAMKQQLLSLKATDSSRNQEPSGRA